MNNNDFFDIIKYTYTKYGRGHLYSALYSALYDKDYNYFSQYNIYDTENTENKRKDMQALIEQEANSNHVDDTSMVFIINLLNNYMRIIMKREEPANELEDILLSSARKSTISLYRLMCKRLYNKRFESIDPELEGRLRDYEYRLDGQDIIENILQLMTDEFAKEIKYSKLLQKIEEREDQIVLNRFYSTTAKNCAILSGIRNENSPETQATINRGTLNIVSSIGNCRAEQQDAGIIMTHPKNSKLKMIAVCDGAGGMEEGEIASDILVELVRKWFIKNGKGLFNIDRRKLNEKIKKDFANMNTDAIREFVKRTDPEYLENPSQDNIFETIKMKFNKEKPEIEGDQRPGSTLAMAIMNEGEVIAINVGDSRVYAKKDGKLYQISKDQSYVEQLYDKQFQFDYPQVNPDDMRFHQYANYSELFFQNDDPSPNVVKIRQPDLVMVCTDGMCDCLSFDEIAYISGNVHGNEIANYLVSGANIRTTRRPSYLVGVPGMNKREIQAGKDNSTVATADLRENADKGLRGGFER